MIEQALYEHLKAQDELADFLAVYNDDPAVFNQAAPPDTDELWGEGPQYGRVVFAVDMQGDPARTMGGMLAVDILCKEDEQVPEDIEPIIRSLIHGYFFSTSSFTVAAQWKNSSYFTEPVNHVAGCTVSFELLGFPIQGTSAPDIIGRVNHWSREALQNVHVINHDRLPSDAWKPEGAEAAIYWRLVTDRPAGWIPDTFHTNWRTAIIRCHVFTEDNARAASLAREIAARLHAKKRLMKEGESQIMVNRNNTVDASADPLSTGQVTVEATYGLIVRWQNEATIQRINF